MNLVLIGYRGTGKTAVAKILTQRLGMSRFSTDAVIVQRERRSIPEIVKQDGWDYFRAVETAVIAELADRDNIILDTGGGAVVRQENRSALKKNGLVFWLKAAPETIASRIKGDTNRPALTPGKTFLEEISEVLAQRQDAYRAAADIEIETDGKTPEDIATEIIAHMHSRFTRS